MFKNIDCLGLNIDQYIDFFGPKILFFLDFHIFCFFMVYKVLYTGICLKYFCVSLHVLC